MASSTGAAATVSRSGRGKRASAVSVTICAAMHVRSLNLSLNMGGSRTGGVLFLNTFGGGGVFASTIQSFFFYYWSVACSSCRSFAMIFFFYPDCHT